MQDVSDPPESRNRRRRHSRMLGGASGAEFYGSGSALKLRLVAETVEKVRSGPDFWCPLLVRADLLAPPQGPGEAVLRCLSMGLKLGGIDQAVTG